MTYYENPAVNKSTLWWLRKSPAHFQWARTAETPDTPAMRFGRAVHSAILTPSEYLDSYVVFTGDRRTKAGKEEYQALVDSGAEILSEDDAETIREMMKACPDSVFNGCEFEKELFWTDPDTGVSCKGRLDAVRHGAVIDYKTTTDASTDGFSREAIRYGYDLQAAMYLVAAKANGYGDCEFWFVAQEKSTPYAVNVIKAGDAFLDRGRWLMLDLLTKYKECAEKDEWPGYGTNELIIPEWAVMDE